MNKRVLITGASRGLGARLAIHFAKAGYDLVLTAREPKSFQHVMSALREYDVEKSLVVGDLTSPGTLEAILKVLEDRPITHFISNAAILGSGRLTSVTNESMRDVLSVNLLAPMLLARSLYRKFLEQKFGTMVFISSMAAYAPSSGEAAYAASKGGLKPFVQVLRKEAQDDRLNLRVLEVFLGAMNTDMTWQRDDQRLLIDPNEVAAEIVAMLESPNETMRVESLEIKRTRY
jgi:short-subunit dehydrogenase